MATLFPDVLLVAAPTRFRTRLLAQLRQRWPTRPVQLAADPAQAAALAQERPFGLLLLAGLGREVPVGPLLADLGQHCPAQPVVVLRSAAWGAAHPLPPYPPHILLAPSQNAALAAAALAPWLDAPVPAPPVLVVVPPGAAPASLSARERDVLQLLTDDATNAEIADALCLSEHTVDFHRRALRRKAGTRTGAGLVAFALRNGWLA